MNTDEVDALIKPIETSLAPLRAVLLGTPAVTPAPPAPVPIPAAPTPAVIAPAATLPRLTAASLSVGRTWRLPRGGADGFSHAFGGLPLALDEERDSLFVGNNAGRLAEVGIPPPGEEFGSWKQDFVDPSEGEIAALSAAVGPAAIGGIVVADGELCIDALVYYDALSAQKISHFFRPRDLSVKGKVSPLYSVGDPNKTGYVSRYMAPVPLEWQVRLGGRFVTGCFGVPVVARTSNGPSLDAFTPTRGAMAATPLVNYPGDHPTIGAWGATTASLVYGQAADCAAVVIINGTSTVLFIGRNGIGLPRYGTGTSDLSKDGTVSPGPDGTMEHWAYDPTNGNKGTHAYPYRYQIWAYDLEDLAQVAAGTWQPWDVLPYGVWPLELPGVDPAFTGLGACYHPGRKRIYVTQLRADTDGYESRALVHEINVSF